MCKVRYGPTFDPAPSIKSSGQEICVITAPVPCVRHEAIRKLIIDFRSYHDAICSVHYAALFKLSCTCTYEHFNTLAYGTAPVMPLSFACDLHGCRDRSLSSRETLDVAFYHVLYLVPNYLGDGFDTGDGLFPRHRAIRYMDMTDHCDHYGEYPK